jgi:hypothetical protein
MSITETTASPQHTRRAGAELVRSAGRARAADSVSRRLLPAFHFGFGQEINLDSMHRVIAGRETMYFGMSVSDAYLAATVNVAFGERLLD